MGRGSRSKGITPVIAIVMILMLTLVVAGGAFAFVTGVLQDEQSEASRAYNTEIEIKGVSGDRLLLQNSGSTVVTPTIRAETGEDITGFNATALPPQENRWYSFSCIPQGTETVVVSVGEKEYREEIEEVPLRYCVELTDTHVETRGFQTYRVFEGRAHLNNASETPYANKELTYQFDDRTTKTVTPDADGRFRFETRWATSYVPQHGIWEYEETYTSPTPIVGRGRFQPPNTVRLEYADGENRVYQTQVVMEERENDKFDLVYDVYPERITADNVTFTVNMRITPKQGLIDDWTAHPDAKLLYQVPVSKETGPYAEISGLSCSSSSGVSCRDGRVTYTLNTSVRDRQFNSDALPVDAAGEKYVPVRMDVAADGMDAIAGLNPYFRVHHGGTAHDNPDFAHQWYFMRNDKRMLYVQNRDTFRAWENLTLEYLRDELQRQFSTDATINTTYRLGQMVVTTPNGWGNRPRLAPMHAYFGLNSAPEFSSDSPASESVTNVMYDWNEVEQRTYNLNFTVTLQRASNDKRFLLPLQQGTFGLFPADGGKALPVGDRYGAYAEGGVRYPLPGDSGYYSFNMLVPGTDSATRAAVYKITVPKEDDRWTAKTYVLNADPTKLERVYLLNARGQWDIFEATPDDDGQLDTGERYVDNFSIDAEPDELVQLNLRMQLINGGAEEPEYSDWPYTFQLTVNNSTGSTTYDLSTDTRCSTRHCLSYRVGNREESRPIDSLRGPSAPKSVFNELDDVGFVLENAASSDGAASLRLRHLKFWTWYLQPYTDDLESELSNNPDKLVVKTTEHPPYRQGRYARRFD